MSELAQPAAAPLVAEQATLLRDCPICHTDNTRVPAAVWSQAPWQLKTCAGCGFLYLENPPPPADFSEDFAWERTHADERQRRRQKEPVLVGLNDLRIWIAARLVHWRRGGKIIRWIERYVGQGRVVDVGCGHGLLLSAMPEPIVPFGVEISRHLAMQADSLAQQRGGRVVHGPATRSLDAFDDCFCQGVVMRSYLEHEVDPGRALQIAWRILQPGGVVIIKVPNFDCWNRRLVRRSRWCGFRFPDHVNYFTPGSLVRLVEKQGFEIHRFRVSDRLPSSDNMWLVARKSEPVVHGPMQVRSKAG